MAVRTLLAILMAGFSVSGAFAVDSPRCADLNKLYNDKFHPDMNLRWAVGEFSCDGDAVHSVAKAFFDVYKPGIDTDYYGWVRKVTTGFTYDMKCKYYAFNSGGEVTLCNKFFHSDDEGRAATIVHEAAHSRGGDAGHVTCTRGSNKGKDSCDQKLYGTHEGSGYNFEFMYNTALLRLGTYNYLSNAVVRGWVKHEVLNNFNEVTAEQVRTWAN